MTTGCISLHQRQVVATPAGNPAGQFGGGEASLFQVTADTAAVLAHGIDHDDGLGLVLVQLDHPLGELLVGDVQRVDDMAGGEVFVRTHIDNHALLAIDQRGQLTAAEAFAATLQLGKDQQGQRDRESSGQQIVVGGEFKQMSKHQKIPER